MAINLSDPANLVLALRALLQNDTVVIRGAEKALNKWTKDPSCINALLNQITTCEDSAVRHQAALLLKKKIIVLSAKLNKSLKDELKNTLLAIIMNEPVKGVSTALAGVIATLAKTVLAKGQWPELFNLLMQLAQDPREAMRCLCYNLIGQLAEHVSDHLKGHTTTLAQMFAAGCKDAASVVCVEALASTASYIMAIASEPEVMMLHVVIRPMLEVMAACLKAGNEDIVAEGLEVIQECCEMDQPLINDHIDVIVPFVIEIMQSAAYEDQVKQAAGQTLMNILEYRPKLVAKKNLVSPVLAALVDMIVKSDSSIFVPRNNSTHLNDDDEDDASYTSHEEVQQLAQTCLDTMAIHVPSKYFSQPALNLCAQCLESPDPHRRKAGCAVLGVIAEGCCDVIKQTLAQILPRLLGSVQDGEYFVRESACFALGQFSEYCQPEILYFHQTILPVVFGALEDPRPGVQGSSCYVLEMFCENLQADTLRPFLAPLVSKLSMLLQSPQKNTQEMALSALAATAVASELEFLPFAEGVCNQLGPMMFTVDPTCFPVRGRSLECLGHIAVAIGPEHFARYFESGMNSARQGLELNDVALKEFSYVYIANCAKVMTRAFDPFLIQLVPYLLEVITENELSLVAGVDGDADDDDEDEEDEDFEGIDDEDDIGNYRINVNDGFVNSKKAAITAVGTLAEHTKEAFFPFLEDTINCLIQEEIGALHSFHVVVRAEAVSILHHLVGVACAKYGPTQRPAAREIIGLHDLVSQVVKVSLSSFVYLIEQDSERQAVANACEGISGVLEHVGMAALLTMDDKGSHFATSVMDAVKTLLEEKSTCQTATNFEGADDEDDADHDNVLMDSVSDLIGQLAKTIGAEFEPYFANFHGLLMRFTKPSRSYSDRAMAIGCFAEVIAEIGPLANKYAESILPIVQVGLADPMEGVRRNSAFCLGVLVEATGTSLSPHFIAMLQWLYPLCSRNEAQLSSDMGGADIDNALSAVARMINSVRTAIPLAQVLPVMVAALPLRSDHSEGANVYGCLCNLVITGEPSAVAMLPKLFAVFLEVFQVTSKATDETKAVVKSTLVQLCSSPQHQPLFHAALAQCSQEQQQALEALIRS